MISHQSADLSEPLASHHLNYTELSPLCRSLTPVLHQCRHHGRPERGERRPASPATSAGLVSRLGVCDGLPTLPWDIHIFQRRPVQRHTRQEESEENALTGAQVSSSHEAFGCFWFTGKHCEMHLCSV